MYFGKHFANSNTEKVSIQQAFSRNLKKLKDPFLTDPKNYDKQ